MKYFKINTTTNKKFTGKSYLQCKTIPNGVPDGWLNGPDTHSEFTNSQPIIFENKLIFELEDDAILTDVVSIALSTSTYLLVSERLLTILNKYNIPNSSIHDAKVIYKGIAFKYFYIHFIWTEFHGIDYGRTKFIIAKNILGQKIADIEISDYRDWLDKSTKLRVDIVASEIFLGKAFEADLFGFKRLVFARLFISERLKDELERAEITGLDILPQDKVHEFSK